MRTQYKPFLIHQKKSIVSLKLITNCDKYCGKKKFLALRINGCSHTIGFIKKVQVFSFTQKLFWKNYFCSFIFTFFSKAIKNDFMLSCISWALIKRTLTKVKSFLELSMQ